MTYCEGLAFRSLLPSVFPSVEAVESRFKLLEEGVAPLDPEGVVFKDEAMPTKRKLDGLDQVTFNASQSKGTTQLLN